MTNAVTRGFQRHTTSCTRATMNVVTNMTEINARPADNLTICKARDESTLSTSLDTSGHIGILERLRELKQICDLHAYVMSSANSQNPSIGRSY